MALQHPTATLREIEVALEGTSPATAQRHTEAIGLAYEAVQQAEVEHIEQDWPVMPAGSAKIVLGVDGAFVPLLHGEWAEVKTLVVGEVGEPVEVKRERVVPTHTLSYFSRLIEAETFQRLMLGELSARPPAIHPWRRTNYATKACMAQADNKART